MSADPRATGRAKLSMFGIVEAGAAKLAEATDGDLSEDAHGVAAVAILLTREERQAYSVASEAERATIVEAALSSYPELVRRARAAIVQTRENMAKDRVALLTTEELNALFGGAAVLKLVQHAERGLAVLRCPL